MGHAVAQASAVEVSGRVEMDEFAAQASYSGAGNDSFVIKFPAEAMSARQREQLSRFRSVSRSVAIRLPGAVERRAMIVGFGTRDNSFYLTWI